jgi:hypothetical protein
MLKSLFSTALIILFSFNSKSQSVIHTEDIDNYWVAYDSIKTITDKAKQVEVFKRLYNSKGSEGLKAFMLVKNFNAAKQVEHINKYPKFWESIRPRTMLVNSKKMQIEEGIAKFKKIYPDLKPSKMYFTIGGLNSGGTTQADKILVGAEIAMGNKTVDCSEFESDWLKNVFAGFEDENIVGLNVHEYVHTQQSLENEDKTLLLGNAILEGACDFITNLILPSYMPHYIPYYQSNELKIWNQFYFEKQNKSKSQWIGTGLTDKIPMDDLGYAVGFTISKHYYDKAKNKQQAIKDIITLNYADTVAVNTFLKKSGYEKYLKAKGFKPKKGVIEGYSIVDEKVMFEFNISEKDISKLKTKIESVSLAGEFNNWDPKNVDFQLSKVNETKYTLAIEKAKLGNKGERRHFKFVLNGSNWLDPNFESANKGSSNDSNTNLYLEL